ncbi:MAG TPA: hypothetical protein DCL77_02790 [Prolixibacteraceae bacterium]|jgi:UPF0176 protein|nr:hypothetical protein [Prolixibacteraceae bacterium]
MFLYNRINTEVLKCQLQDESFSRRTISFYRYFILDHPNELRNKLYEEWFSLNCFGRIYIAREGINAQMSIPEDQMEAFFHRLKQYPIFDQIPIIYAIEDDGKSFYKLTVKVRDKLVADGLKDDTFDVTNVGKHLSAEEFHQLVDSDETIVVDVRNYYESEIGHFKNAICPKVDTFREEIEMVSQMLTGKEERKILLYCTGGIRCEKASAYLKHHGFKDVNQLHGGILEYARKIKQLDLTSNFIGKNFVFDDRMGESVNGQVIAHCHQCGNPCDIHTNCANDLCHLLFIQCAECAVKNDRCCSRECSEVKNGTEADKQSYLMKHKRKFGNRQVYRKSFVLANNSLERI